MSAAKTMARGVVIWLSLGAMVKADGMETSSWRSSGSWYFFFKGRSSKLDSPNGYTNFYSDPSANQTPSSPPPVYTAPAAPTASSSVPSAAFTPVQSQVNPAPSVPTPATNFASTPPPSSNSARTYDAFVNLGASGFLESNQLTTGNPQPWYTSPAVEKVFNGIPNADQQKQFTDSVLSRVEQTFSQAGLHPSITADPNAHANHVLSIVSGASYGPNSNAIGITDVGNNGFGFIDKLSYGSDVNSLEWAVAHNVSHELMHAFGVGQHPDITGNFIDAATASWDLLTRSDATFSPGAISAIQATNFGNVSSSVLGAEGIVKTIDGDQEILAAPVPEPATIAIWGLLATGAVFCHHRKRNLFAA